MTSLGKDMAFGKLFWINIGVISAYALFTFLPSAVFQALPMLSYFHSFATLALVFPVVGLNLTIIIEKAFRQEFDWLERLNLAACASLIFSPLILTLEYSLLGILNPWLPLMNALVVFLIAIAYHPLALEAKGLALAELKRLMPVLLVAAALYGGLVFAIVTAYYPLPDSDPYYWTAKLLSERASDTITPLALHRSLFSSFSYIVQVTAGTDFYGYFKYLLPALLLFVLFPTALIARLFRERLTQLVIFLLPLSSASFILYFELPIPQAIFNLILVFFAYCIVYSGLTRREFFYFFAGGMMLFSYFYHEIAVLFFGPWLIITLIYHFSPVKNMIARNRLSVFLLLVIVFVYNHAVLSPLYAFLIAWTKNLLGHVLRFQTNFTFPVSYTNIDGNAVGWGNLLGVMKYYAYYVGPAVFVATIMFAFLLSSREARQMILQTSKQRPELPLLALIFAFFFGMAEILPRLFSISFLPERSWGFAGLFLLAFVPAASFYQRTANRTWLTAILIIALFANMLAAIHVNSLKKYLISPVQVASAEWIKRNLPEERVIFTHENYWGIITLFSQSEIYPVSDDRFFSSLDSFEIAFDRFRQNSEFLKSEYATSLAQAREDLDRLQRENGTNRHDSRLLILQGLSDKIDRMIGSLEKERLKPPSLVGANDRIPYVYYTRPSDKNPYADRPYFRKNERDISARLLFDRYPERFKRVYAAPADEVVIWEVISK